jgi:Tfp pilus assembly protein PilF
LIVAATGLVLLLYFLGRTVIRPPEQTASVAASQTQVIDFELIEKNFINQNSAPDSVVALVNRLKETPNDTFLLLKLATAYQYLHQPHLAGYYFRKLAEVGKNAFYYEKAGNAFLNAYKNNIDTNISNNLFIFAVQSFQKAIDLEPDNISPQLSLATIYIESGAEPMKGIEILKEIVDKNPNNVEALILLGRFSLQSGQYDKAKERLEKALAVAPNNVEAAYFLAFTEAELGNKASALELIEFCKKAVNNPDFDKEIEHFINELKK